MLKSFCEVDVVWISDPVWIQMQGISPNPPPPSPRSCCWSKLLGSAAVTNTQMDLCVEPLMLDFMLHVLFILRRFNDKIKHIKILSKDGCFYIAESRLFRTVLVRALTLLQSIYSIGIKVWHHTASVALRRRNTACKSTLDFLLCTNKRGLYIEPITKSLFPTVPTCRQGNNECYCCGTVRFHN